MMFEVEKILKILEIEKKDCLIVRREKDKCISYNFSSINDVEKFLEKGNYKLVIIFLEGKRIEKDKIFSLPRLPEYLIFFIKTKENPLYLVENFLIKLSSEDLSETKEIKFLVESKGFEEFLTKKGFHWKSFFYVPSFYKFLFKGEGLVKIILSAKRKEEFLRLEKIEELFKEKEKKEGWLLFLNMLQSLKRKIIEKENIIKLRDKEIEILRDRLKSLERIIQVKKKELLNLRREKEQLVKRKDSELREKNAEKNRLIRKFCKTVKLKEMEIARTSKEIEKLRTEIFQKDEKIKELERKIVEKDREIKNAEEKIKNFIFLKERLERESAEKEKILKREIEEMRRKLEEEMRKKEEIIKLKEKENEEIRKKLNETIARTSKEIEKLRTEIFQKDEKIKELERKINHLKMEVKKKEDAIYNLSNLVRRLVGEKELLKKEIEEFHKSIGYKLSSLVFQSKLGRFLKKNIRKVSE